MVTWDLLAALLSAWLELSYHNGAEQWAPLMSWHHLERGLWSPGFDKQRVPSKASLWIISWHHSESNSTRYIPQSFFLPTISINPMRHIQHSINALFPPFFARPGSLPLKVFVIKSHLECNLVELSGSGSVIFWSWLNSSEDLMVSALLPLSEI